MLRGINALKLLRRRVVERKYAPEIEAMYTDPPGGHPVEEAAAATAG